MLPLDLSTMIIQVMLEKLFIVTIAGTKWRKERKHKGEETKTIKVGGSEVDLLN